MGFVGTKSRPTLCICIPCYNVGAYLTETLNSIKAQTYQDFRVKILDNCSTDNTVEMARKFISEHPQLNIQIIEFSQFVNAEQSVARCSRHFDCEYAAIFHGDDIYDSQILELSLQELEKNPDIGAVFSGKENIDKDARLISGDDPFFNRIVKDKSKKFGFEELFQNMVVFGAFLNTPTFVGRAIVVSGVIENFYSPSFASASDQHAWLSLSKVCNIMVLNRKLIKYRRSPASNSFNLIKKIKTNPDFVKLVEFHHSQQNADFSGYIEYQRVKYFNRNVLLLLKSRQHKVTLEYPKLSANVFFVAGTHIHVLKSLLRFVFSSFLLFGFKVVARVRG